MNGNFAHKILRLENEMERIFEPYIILIPIHQDFRLSRFRVKPVEFPDCVGTGPCGLVVSLPIRTLNDLGP